MMNNLYGNVFAALPGYVCLIDVRSQHLSDCNEAFDAEILSKKDFLGVKFESILPSASDRAYFNSVCFNFTAPSTTLDELAVRASRGNIVVKWTVTKIPANDVLLLVGTLVGESAPVEAAPQADSGAADASAAPVPYSKQDLVHIINRIPIGFHSVADDGLILFANQCLLAQLGYEWYEYVGQRIQNFVEIAKLMPYASQVHSGDTFDMPYSLRAKDGSWRHYMALVDTSQHGDGSFHYTRTFFRTDVNQYVSEAVSQERVNKMSQLAAEKDRFLRVVFHEIRTPLHNLSNTFTGVIKQSKLSNVLVDELLFQIDACSGLVEDLSYSTMFESDQVLHPRPVRMNLRKELEAILHHVNMYHELELSAKTVRLNKDVDFSIPEYIAVDRAVLKALSNVIKNAVKYCAEGGTVDILMSYEPPADPAVQKCGSLSVTIKNSVVEALDLVHVNRLFQSCYNTAPMFAKSVSSDSNPVTPHTPHTPHNFSSALNLLGAQPTSALVSPLGGSSAGIPGTESPSSSLSDSLVSSEGLGIGLFVAYNIVSNLGGLLECRSEDGMAVFSFKLLVEEAPQKRRLIRGSKGDMSSPTMGHTAPKKWFHAIDSAEGSRHLDRVSVPEALDVKRLSISTTAKMQGHKPFILVVDDSPVCRKVLVKALESSGYATDTACDGQEACSKLEQKPCMYDLVLMDLRMPIMDGITATRVCKARPHLAEVPIIIVTAELGEDVRRECMEAGASHFISKPVKMLELLDLVEQFSS